VFSSTQGAILFRAESRLCEIQYALDCTDPIIAATKITIVSKRILISDSILSLRSRSVTRTPRSRTPYFGDPQWLARDDGNIGDNLSNNTIRTWIKVFFVKEGEGIQRFINDFLPIADYETVLRSLILSAPFEDYWNGIPFNFV
jgi:hypothetical protein